MLLTCPHQCSRPGSVRGVGLNIGCGFPLAMPDLVSSGLVGMHFWISPLKPFAVDVTSSQNSMLDSVARSATVLGREFKRLNILGVKPRLFESH